MHIILSLKLQLDKNKNEPSCANLNNNNLVISGSRNVPNYKRSGTNEIGFAKVILVINIR